MILVTVGALCLSWKIIIAATVGCSYAMSRPEDSEGSDILDRFNAVPAEPNDRMKGRALAEACFDAFVINTINVRGSFLPAAFSVESC